MLLPPTPVSSSCISFGWTTFLLQVSPITFSAAYLPAIVQGTLAYLKSVLHTVLLASSRLSCQLIMATHPSFTSPNCMYPYTKVGNVACMAFYCPLSPSFWPSSIPSIAAHGWTILFNHLDLLSGSLHSYHVCPCYLLLLLFSIRLLTIMGISEHMDLVLQCDFRYVYVLSLCMHCAHVFLTNISSTVYHSWLVSPGCSLCWSVVVV